MTNEVLLSGSVVRIEFNKDKTRAWVTIAINGKTSIFPQIVFSGEMAEKVKEISLYSNIKIKAMIERFKNPKSEKWLPVITALDFQQDAFGKYESMNSVVVEGTILSIYEVSENVSFMTIENETEWNGKIIRPHVEVPIFRNHKEMMEGYKQGDHVIIKGFITVKKKKKNDKDKTSHVYMDIFLKKIRKA